MTKCASLKVFWYVWAFTIISLREVVFIFSFGEGGISRQKDNDISAADITCVYVSALASTEHMNI